MIGMMVAGHPIAKLFTNASPSPDLFQAWVKLSKVKLGSRKTVHQPVARASSLGRNDVIRMPMTGTIQRKQMNQTAALASGDAAPWPPPAPALLDRENRPPRPRPAAWTGAGVTVVVLLIALPPRL